MEKHHGIARSRHGPDDEWNLVELSEYDHAYKHAVDFVLFDIALWFDCRMTGWKMLPDDLRETVLAEQSRRASLRTGETNSNFGNRWSHSYSPEHAQNVSSGLRGKPKSAEHCRKISESKTGKKMAPQGPEARRNKSIGATKGWETRRKNQQQS